jgi:hypothetical protein
VYRVQRYIREYLNRKNQKNKQIQKSSNRRVVTEEEERERDKVKMESEKSRRCEERRRR